jgi:hypothetical protein
MSDATIRDGFRHYLAAPDARTGLDAQTIERLVGRLQDEVDLLDYEERVRMYLLALTYCRKCGHSDLKRFDHGTYASVYCKMCQESWQEQRPHTVTPVSTGEKETSP